MPMELWRFCRDLWDPYIFGWVDGCRPVVLSMVGSGWVWLCDLQIGHCTTRLGEERRRFVGHNMQTIMSQGATERERERERERDR